MLQFWAVLLTTGACAAGVLQALGPPPHTFAEAGTGPRAASTPVAAEAGRPEPASPVPIVQAPGLPPPEPVQASKPPAAEAPASPPEPLSSASARQADRGATTRLASPRPSASVRRHSRSEQLELALERLRRERPAAPDEAPDTFAQGEEPGYASAEPWHAPVQYPWLYGWPIGTQAYFYPYPGRR